MKRMLLTWCLIVAWSATGCWRLIAVDDGSGDGTPTEALPLGEPIVLAQSNGVAPSSRTFDEATRIVDATFDLGSVELVREGRYNDLTVTYTTPSTCDEELLVFNVSTGLWDRIGFPDGQHFWCGAAISRHGHLFSSRDLLAHDCVGPNLQVRVKGRWASPDSLYAFEMNPKYRPIPLLIPHTYTWGQDAYESIVYGLDGLTYDGESFWLSSNSTDQLYRLSVAGELIEEFDAPSGYPFGMAYDGQNLWLADGTDRIFKLDRSGNALASFSVPTDFPGGLTWGAGKLWLSEYQGPHRVFGIDADPSCSAGSAVVTTAFEIPGGGSPGLAWDGEHLIVPMNFDVYSSTKLYVMTAEGQLVRQYDLPVHSVQDIVWDGSALWMLHAGPRGVSGRDPVLSRFKLP